jgi:GTP pyrophosphokinase
MINGKIAALDATLKSGDVVEIIKKKTPRTPSKNWLRFVKTHRAKLEIKKAILAQGVIV